MKQSNIKWFTRSLFLHANLIGKLLIFVFLIFTTKSVLAQGGLDSGLVAYWPFSHNANDSTGNGHNGTVTGASLTLDRFGRDSMAYDFNGSSDYIQVADDSVWAFGTRPFTILLWVNFRVVSHYYIIGQSEGGGPTVKWIIMLEIGLLRYHLNSPQTGPIYPVQHAWQPSANHWYQIAVTRQANQFNLYVDSTLLASGLDTHAVRNVNAPLLFGRAEGTLTFNGRLDDIRIYNRTLSAQEIKTLYSQVLTGVAGVNNFPVAFKLSQNYPNPFNPSTSIKFDLPVGDYAALKIYDLLGREIAILKSEYLEAGTHEVEWDASNYPSGIYFYKLISGNYAETKRMVLLK